MPHPDGSVDPLRDAKMLELELILADLATVERRLERLEANIKKANKAEDVAERALFLRLKEALEAEKPLRELELSDEEQRRLRGYAFLSGKPMLLVVNLGRGRDQARPRRASSAPASRPSRASPGSRLCAVSAPIEAEMAELAARGRAGLPRRPGPRRARPRPRDPLDLRAARAHLVPDRGRGRVPGLDDPARHARPARRRHHPLRHRARLHPRRRWWPSTTSWRPARSPPAASKGTLRLEGKDYVVQDGDVIEFRFNV